MREKSIKNWRRVWKLELIEEDNPTWLCMKILFEMASGFPRNNLKAEHPY